MTNRFVETISTGIITDNLTGKEYNCEYRVSNDFIELINQLAEENEQLKQENTQFKILVNELKNQNQKLKGRLNDLGVEYYD